MNCENCNKEHEERKQKQRFTVVKNFGIYQIVDGERQLSGLLSHTDEFIAQKVCDHLNTVNNW